MNAKGKSRHVEALLDLIGLKGDFQWNGQRWLRADQPTIAARLGCSPRTLRTVIKDPMFDTHRTRVDGRNVTLIRRADPQTTNRQSGKSKSAATASKSATTASKSATTACKSASIRATFEQQATREELRLIWVARKFMPHDSRVSKDEYGLLLQLAKLGITPDEFRYVLYNWKEFLTCVNAIHTDDGCTSALKAYQPRPWLSTMVDFHAAIKEVYLTHQQATKTEIDKLAQQL